MKFPRTACNRQLKSYPFGHGKLCFRTARAMLSDSGSYAFGPRELCFRTARAMLSELGSNALDLTEQCSGPYGACLYIPIEQCFSTYGAMLWRVRSSAITSDKFQVSSFKFFPRYALRSSLLAFVAKRRKNVNQKYISKIYQK